MFVFSSSELCTRINQLRSKFKLVDDLPRTFAIILHLRPDGTFSHLLVAVGPSPETIKTNTADNAAIIIPYKLTPECDQRHFLQFNTQRVYRL
jgi:hypothetical protein